MYEMDSLLQEYLRRKDVVPDPSTTPSVTDDSGDEGEDDSSGSDKDGGNLFQQIWNKASTAGSFVSNLPDKIVNEIEEHTPIGRVEKTISERAGPAGPLLGLIAEQLKPGISASFTESPPGQLFGTVRDVADLSIKATKGPVPISETFGLIAPEPLKGAERDLSNIPGFQKLEDFVNSTINESGSGKFTSDVLLSSEQASVLTSMLAALAISGGLTSSAAVSMATKYGYPALVAYLSTQKVRDAIDEAAKTMGKIKDEPPIVEITTPDTPPTIVVNPTPVTVTPPVVNVAAPDLSGLNEALLQLQSGQGGVLDALSALKGGYDVFTSRQDLTNAALAGALAGLGRALGELSVDGSTEQAPKEVSRFAFGGGSSGPVRERLTARKEKNKKKKVYRRKSSNHVTRGKKTSARGQPTQS